MLPLDWALWISGFVTGCIPGIVIWVVLKERLMRQDLQCRWAIRDMKDRPVLIAPAMDTAMDNEAH